MTLGIRKLVVLGVIGFILLAGNALVLAHWLNEMGVIQWAGWLRSEFLTGTTIAVIVALLILLVPASGSSTWFRRCPTCDHSVSRQAKYCGECGGRV